MSLLALIDEIDALITNGAKPAAIKAKLYAMREQAQALDGELSAIKAKYDQLEARHDKAVADLTKQIAALKEAQSPPVVASVPHGDLTEDEVKILQLLSQRPGIGSGLVGHLLQISRTRAELLTDKLVSDGYVHDLVFLGQSKEYELEHKGREYLARHGLA
jgi:hypothetical protein